MQAGTGGTLRVKLFFRTFQSRDLTPIGLPSTCCFCLFSSSVCHWLPIPWPSRWWHTSSLPMLHRPPLHAWARAAPLPDSTRLTLWQPSSNSHSWTWWKKWRGGLDGRVEHPASPLPLGLQGTSTHSVSLSSHTASPASAQV